MTRSVARRFSALLLGVALVVGCGDDGMAPDVGILAWDAATAREQKVLVGFYHSSSVTFARSVVQTDGATARVGVEVRVPRVLNADNKFTCIRVRVDQRVERVLHLDGGRPGPVKLQDGEPTADDALRAAFRRGRCKSLPARLR